MRPRCIRVVADAGWGKTTFARTYAAVVPDPSATIDCRLVTDVAEFDAATAEALAALGPASRPTTLIIDSARRLIGVEHAIDRLRELLRTSPANRTIVVCTRTELPIVWSTYFQPHEIATIGPRELAIDADELDILFGAVERGSALDVKILNVSQGWPIAVLLFVRLTALGTIESVLDTYGDSAAFGDLHEYVQAEIFADLTEPELETLCIVAALRELSAKDTALALGRDATHELDALSGRMRYLLACERDVYHVVPLALAAAERMQRERMRDMLLVASERFALAGRHVSAADAALRGGFRSRARAHLDNAGDPVPRFSPSTHYVQTALTLGIDELARSQNVLAIMLSARISPSATVTLDATVAARLAALDPNDPDTELRTVLRIASAALLQFSGRFDEAERNAVAAERDLGTFADSHAPIVRALYVARSMLAAHRGDYAAAEAYWTRSGEPSNANETYYFLERNTVDIIAASATARWAPMADAFTRAAEIVRAVADQTNEGQARVFAAGAVLFRTGRLPTMDLLHARVAETRFSTEPTTPNAHRSRLNVLAMLDAALKQSDRDLQIELMLATIEAADQVGVAYYRTLTRVVAAVISPADRSRLFEEALALPIPELERARIIEVRDGHVAPDSVYAPFLAGLANDVASETPAVCRLEIMRAVVSCAGNDVKLRPRELELLVSLALSAAPIARETLLDRMWPDQDESAATGSLRSTMHRLRAQLNVPDLIVREGNRFKLSPAVAVDIIETEALYNIARRSGAVIGSSERFQLNELFATLAHGIPEIYTRWAWFAAVEVRLVDLRHGLGMLLARDDFENARFAAAARFAERLIDVDPLDEGAAAMLYLCLRETGGKSEASRWLRRYREMLATEYGQEPSFELERLEAGGTSAGAL